MVKSDNELSEKLKVHASKKLQVKVISHCTFWLSFPMILSLPYVKPLGDSLFKKREND